MEGKGERYNLQLDALAVNFCYRETPSHLTAARIEIELRDLKAIERTESTEYLSIDLL